MAGTIANIRVEKLSNRKLTAVKRRAKDLGLTPGAYVKQLIEDDLRLEHEARTKDLWEIAAPLTKALQGLTEDEVDAIVDKARRSGGKVRPKWR